MKLLTLFCVVLQILDGIFTALGVSFLPQGLNAEGNILVKEAMRYFGVVPALLCVKGFGIAIILKLYQLKAKMILSVVCGLYSITALLWIIVLFRWLT